MAARLVGPCVCSPLKGERTTDRAGARARSGLAVWAAVLPMANMFGETPPGSSGSPWWVESADGASLIGVHMGVFRGLSAGVVAATVFSDETATLLLSFF